MARLGFVMGQIRDIEDARRKRLEQQPETGPHAMGACVMVLNAIYEGDFCGFSYGFRPGRGPHDALDALCVAIDQRKVNWIVDADIRDFLDLAS